MATTHAVHSCDTRVWVWSRKQWKHSHMYEPYKSSKLLPIKILEAAYSLLLILLLLFRRAKKKCLKVSQGPQTPLVACVFYFVSICIPVFGSMWPGTPVFGTCPCSNVQKVWVRLVWWFYLYVVVLLIGLPHSNVGFSRLRERISLKSWSAGDIELLIWEQHVPLRR